MRDADAVPPLPGETTVNDPSDLELFLLNVADPDKKGAGGRIRARPIRRPAGPVGFWR